MFVAANRPFSSPADVCYNQLGGIKICLLTGCKVIIGDADLTMIQIKTSRCASRVVVHYNSGTDLYDVTIYRKINKDQVLCSQTDIPVENLQEYIERGIDCFISFNRPEGR